jgi:broad specificity phosphatase PhoE
VPARWLLVRHGPTTGGAQGGVPDGAPSGVPYAGWSDVPLGEAGRVQAARLGRRLAPVPLGAAYASDLARARHTLEAVLAGRAERPPVRLDPDLRELNFGAWEGLTYAAIAAQPDGPAVLAGEQAAPGGESLADLAARVRRFLDRLERDDSTGRDGASLVVAHGGPLRVLLCHLLGLPRTAHWRFRLDHTSLSEVLWEPATGPVLVRLNDRSHLEPEGGSA